MISSILGFLLGVLTLFGYMIWRMMRNPGWDKSNITNAVRLISHVVLHPEDFSRMWYVQWDDETKQSVALRRPFWYIGGDEFADVVKTRPPEGHFPEGHKPSE